MAVGGRSWPGWERKCAIWERVVDADGLAVTVDGRVGRAVPVLGQLFGAYWPRVGGLVVGAGDRCDEEVDDVLGEQPLAVDGVGADPFGEGLVEGGVFLA